MADTFKSEHIPSTFNWEFCEGSAHRARHRRDEPVHFAVGAGPVPHHQRRAPAPIGTLYDPFIARGLDALNYAVIRTRASYGGDTLRHYVGGRRRRASIDRRAADRVGQDGLAVRAGAGDELAAIMRWAFSYMQKDGDAAPSEQTGLRDETGGSVHPRLSTRPVEQIQRKMTRSCANRSSMAPIGIANRGLIARWSLLHRRGRARGNRGRRPDGGGPPRRRLARDHFRRPVNAGWDRRATSA